MIVEQLVKSPYFLIDINDGNDKYLDLFPTKQ